MDGLLLRFLRGETGQAEEERISAWLAESPEHEARLEDLRMVLSMARARDERAVPGPPPKASEIIFQAGLQAGEGPKQAKSRWSRRTLVSLGSAAAAVCVALGALGLWDLSGFAGSKSLAAEEFSTGAGESTTVRMTDGSVVRLGPNSRLQIMSADASRQVVLEGRAFFAVTRDASRPFRVITPAGHVRVLGTRFEVRADVSEMRLVVVEGSVVLGTGDSEIQVGTGEMTEVTKGKSSEVVRAPGLGELSDDWMGQFLLFQETPLEKAVQEMGEVFGVEIQILEQALKEKTLTMWFSSRPLEEVLSVICSVIDARCRLNENVVTIGG